MTFDDILEQVITLLKRQGRVSYRALKMRFEELDDAYLDVLKDEILYVHESAVQADARGFTWTGERGSPEADAQRKVADEESRFYALLPEVTARLQREGRVTYRTLKYVFGLDDTLLEEIREELHLRHLALDDGGKVLAWTGEAITRAQPASSVTNQRDTSRDVVISPASRAPRPPIAARHDQAEGPPALPEAAPVAPPPDERHRAPEPLRSAPDAERRQLTVMFCDLVGSTDLSGKLDPEDLREVVRAYQEMAAEVIERYEGHIAQYLGDGLLVYFGFPVAHEDDAPRAVYTGLEIPEAMAILNPRLKSDYGVELAVRIGIHTGPVVVGEMGSSGRSENLAMGETPNIAARLEGLAQPNTIVISAVTAQLVQRTFTLQALGSHNLKGVAAPIMLFKVVAPREVERDDDTTTAGGFDALAGRHEEIGLLLRCWEQSKAGCGQVVLIHGEAGLGKSCLVDGLRLYVRQEKLGHLVFRCSPYHTNSALHPIIQTIPRALHWLPGDTAETQLEKLERNLSATNLPLEEAVPLTAALLSLPLPADRYPPLTLSPPQLRQQTCDLLVARFLDEAERQPMLLVWEDLHWADPSTLEFLGLLMDQTPTSAMLHVLTSRPDFEPPWPMRSHMTPIMLHRLEPSQVESMIARLTGGKTLPTEVSEHILAKTDGVPLYAEELTKMLLASDLLREETDRYEMTGPLLSMAIPDTLQDSLMARLDQLNHVKDIAQLGAVVGREFPYPMLQALSGVDEARLQDGLAQLVASELLYQRGQPPRSNYIFKHALIQDAAYASLLRSRRQQLHRQVAQLLETQFRDVLETQPEVVAHHYTEANQLESAISYWRRAGQQARQRMANPEAVNHLQRGLTLLATLPDTPEHAQQELQIHMTLGPALIATKGHGAPEVESAYQRAQALCDQLEEDSQRFSVLLGLSVYYLIAGPLETAHNLSSQLLHLAQNQRDPTLLQAAHLVTGQVLFFVGELPKAHAHLLQAIALTEAAQSRPSPYPGSLPEISCMFYDALALWLLGFPDQAHSRMQQTLSHVRARSHPLSLVATLFFAVILDIWRGDRQNAQLLADEFVSLSVAHSLALFEAYGTILQGWLLVLASESGPGLTLMQQGLEAFQHTGCQAMRSHFLTLLATARGTVGQTEAEHETLETALGVIGHYGDRLWEAERHRLQGESILGRDRSQLGVERTRAEAAGACFDQALAVARHQEAKSFELRAAMSLSRLWQQQGKRDEARHLLEEVYNGFTEGFETADLQCAKNLLEALAR